MDVTMTKPRRSGAKCQGRLTYRSKARLTTSETVSSRSCALSRAAAHRSSGIRIARGVSGMVSAPFAHGLAQQGRVDDELLHLGQAATLSQPMVPVGLGLIGVGEFISADCRHRSLVAGGEDVEGAAIPSVYVVSVAHGVASFASPLGCIYSVIHLRIYSQAHLARIFGRVA